MSRYYVVGKLQQFKDIGGTLNLNGLPLRIAEPENEPFSYLAVFTTRELAEDWLEGEKGVDIFVIEAKGAP